MICTPVTINGKNFDVVWKPGATCGPKIGQVYFHNSERLVPAWEQRRDEFMRELLKTDDAKKRLPKQK
jgi:hypothetical protein